VNQTEKEKLQISELLENGVTLQEIIKALHNKAMLKGEIIFTYCFGSLTVGTISISGMDI